MNVEPPETLVIIESIVYKSNGFAIQADRRNCSSGVMPIFFPDLLSLFYLLAAYLQASG